MIVSLSIIEKKIKINYSTINENEISEQKYYSI